MKWDDLESLAQTKGLIY